MKKVLVVEDDKFLANAYRVKLTKAGFDVKIASNGVDALKTLSEYIPNIILLDLILPEKDGFEVLSALKANDKWENIPVLVASNLGQKEDIQRVMRMGANGFITKTESALSEVVTKINSLTK